jgi:short-subunit dehydrogenase
MKKVVLITGASSGIGKETAILLAQQNYTVYAAARRIENMKDLVSHGIYPVELDLTKDESMLKTIGDILGKESRIDVLINNAGYGSYGALEDVSIEEAKRQFEVNVFGLARLTQLVLPTMRKQRSGKIINISSMGGKFGEPHGAWYHSTKYAVEGLSDSLRMELKQFNIDVILIEPGAIKSEWGGIAKENLLNVSGNTAYKNLAEKHANLIDRTYKMVGSEPIVIAKSILRAISARRPKTRYAVGGGAKLILFFRRVLSDKLFDKVMLSQLK